ncbi:MAG: hypothetical protein WBD41_01235 [Rhodococcus sp. (in: high G+C Gram-positive bacteria)]|uniref:hypothetical protein n=1 Tax=Rhodococcus sp. EPR-157 TaxID=1813677 RepID=UPI000A68EC71|nr:hypothetical protein [Rhodococcus sp. EPR-157]
MRGEVRQCICNAVRKSVGLTRGVDGAVISDDEFDPGVVCRADDLDLVRRRLGRR